MVAPLIGACVEAFMIVPVKIPVMLEVSWEKAKDGKRLRIIDKMKIEGALNM
jgi:hypothetical protein